MQRVQMKAERRFCRSDRLWPRRRGEFGSSPACVIGSGSGVVCSLFHRAAQVVFRELIPEIRINTNVSRLSQHPRTPVGPSRHHPLPGFAAFLR